MHHGIDISGEIGRERTELYAELRREIYGQ